jgi:hypothetical protein
MKLTLETSTGIEIVVWRDDEMFHARRASEATEPQICLGVDLFEVIAELAELDLDDTADASEAVLLADHAQLRLREGAAEDGWPAQDSAANEDSRRSS